MNLKTDGGMNFTSNIFNRDGSGFENKNLVINFENFKNSSKNHFYVKLIFNDKNNFSAIPMDVHICKIKNKSGQLKGYSVIVQDITQEIKNKILADL